MAYSVATTMRTPITNLREALDKAERLVVQVDSHSVATFLTLLDNIDQQFEALEGNDFDLRSEQSRWESLLNRINRQPNAIVRAANVAGGMEKLRAAHPPAESFWWHLDKEVMQRRLRAIRQLIVTLVSVVVIVVGGYWAINFFFPPDPDAVLMVETNSSLDRLITEERWQEALDLVQGVRAQLPTNVELMVWEVVLNERLGNQEAAADALVAARQALAGQPIELLIHLSRNRLRAGDIEGALAAGEEALQIDPNDPQVYFVLGGIAEAQGDIPLAISYFEQTFALAENSNPQLAVTARIRMGSLLQSPGSIVTTEPEAEATATP